MSRIYFEALRCLPEAFVDDETRVMEIYAGMVIAAHPMHEPIAYTSTTKRWTPIGPTPPPSK